MAEPIDLAALVAGRLADDAIGLFLEYRDMLGETEAEARKLAVREIEDGIRHEPDDG